MTFWIAWPLWQKLSAVLGFLITLVLIYAFCVLAYNRRTTRKYAAAETQTKGEEAELYPMLAKDDIPFGVRALEQGIQVEGIWVSNHNSPVSSPQPSGTPSGSGPSTPTIRPMPVPPAAPAPPPPFEKAVTNLASLPPYTRHPIHPEVDIVAANRYTYEPQKPGGIYSPVLAPSSPKSPTNFKRRSDIFTNPGKRSSFHTRLARRSQLWDAKTRAGQNDHMALDSGPVGNDACARRPVEQQRAGRMTRTLRRRSSEEFRRRMSAIFNERIHMDLPSEGLQLDPAVRNSHRRSLRKSILEHFQS